MPAEPGMHVSRLGYLRQSARPLQRHFHYQFPIAEQSHCSQSTMLPLIRHGARGSPKLLRSRCHTSYNTRYALDNFAAIRKLVEVLPFTSTELIVHLCLK